MVNIKEIEGFEGRYTIDTDGNIFSKSKKMNQTKDKDGYMAIGLSMNGKTYTRKVHRLVAQMFIPNEENKKTVNHINGIKSDNKVSNLEWNTMSENILHSYAFGLRSNVPNHNFTAAGLIQNKIRSKIIEAFDINNNKIWEHESIRNACVKYSLDYRTVQRVLQGKIKRHKGLFFKIKI